jgi:hypothetical protein
MRLEGSGAQKWLGVLEYPECGALESGDSVQHSKGPFAGQTQASSELKTDLLIHCRPPYCYRVFHTIAYLVTRTDTSGCWIFNNAYCRK